ncbi:MAG: hypothetical protein H3C50_00975 [Kiritimatiellae bacterium]|nr:hypothetical protein [Kiritimatiellia bacterium]MCO5060556.1 hypothetical protein [Kiritimatiellia bacterium]MCO5068262.1 hypothetical protein [Kiritimatiellia bacterium]
MSPNEELHAHPEQAQSSHPARNTVLLRLFLAIAFAILPLLGSAAFAQDAEPAPATQEHVAQSSSRGAIVSWIANLPPGQRTQILQTAVIALLALICVVFILVATRRVVFYYDRSDAIGSVLIFVIPLIGLILAKLLTPENATAEEEVIPHFLLMASLVGSGIACLITIALSIRHNNLIIGLIVGVLKIAMGLLMLITILGISSAPTDRERSAGDRILSAVLMGLTLGLLWKLLVNGREVEQRRQLRTAQRTA